MATTVSGLTPASKKASVLRARHSGMSLFPMKVSSLISLVWRCGMLALESALSHPANQPIITKRCFQSCGLYLKKMTFSRQLLVVYINTNYIKIPEHDVWLVRPSCSASSLDCVTHRYGGIIQEFVNHVHMGLTTSLIKSKPPFRLTVWIIRIDAHRFHWPESKKRKGKKKLVSS